MMMFSASVLAYFSPQHFRGMRVGQAYHNFLSLDKVKGVEKEWCDKFYEADGEIAYAMLRERTDFTQ